jgi:NADH:ubiquinone oxidoreductase subunit B-like Fe-S oxidoreductase
LLDKITGCLEHAQASTFAIDRLQSSTQHKRNQKMTANTYYTSMNSTSDNKQETRKKANTAVQQFLMQY